MNKEEKSPVRPGEWFLQRFPLNMRFLKAASSEPIPNHLKAWWFALGGTAGYLFLIQVVTGVLMAFYYVPNPEHAYESVQHITQDVPFGWYFRSLHRWSSHLMIVAVILHVLRVFFTGAYRKPREFNWMVGALILFCTLGLGFTGYSLVYEQLSYWGMTVATNLMEAVPFAGHILGRFLRGGETLSDNTLTRLFILHVGVLPALVVFLLFLHVLLVRMHGITEFRFHGETDEQSTSPVFSGNGPVVMEAAEEKDKDTYPFFPDHLMTELIIGLGLMILLSALACAVPAGLKDAANPLVTPEHIKPEWYFYFTFRWLKLTGLTFAVLSLGFFAFVFVLWPFVDAYLAKKTGRSEISIYLGIAGFASILILTLCEALTGG